MQAPLAGAREPVGELASTCPNLTMVSALMNPEPDTPRDLSSEVVVRWKDYDANVIPLLKEGGITTVLVQDRNEAFETACRSAGLKVQAREEIQDLPLESLKSTPPKALVALTEGLWPGVGRPGMESDDAFTTGATGRPWVNANAHWFGILRCLYPNRSALLGYLPDEKAGVKPELLVPYDSLELALIEAKANGGNYLLTLEAALPRETAGRGREGPGGLAPNGPHGKMVEPERRLVSPARASHGDDAGGSGPRLGRNRQPALPAVRLARLGQGGHATGPRPAALPRIGGGGDRGAQRRGAAADSEPCRGGRVRAGGRAG